MMDDLLRRRGRAELGAEQPLLLMLILAEQKLSSAWLVWTYLTLDFQ